MKSFSNKLTYQAFGDFSKIESELLHI